MVCVSACNYDASEFLHALADLGSVLVEFGSDIPWEVHCDIDVVDKVCRADAVENRWSVLTQQFDYPLGVTLVGPA